MAETKDSTAALKITLLEPAGPAFDDAARKAVETIVAALAAPPGATFLVENFPLKVDSDLLKEWISHYLHPKRPLTVQGQLDTLSRPVFKISTGFMP